MDSQAKIASRHPVMFKVEKDKEYYFCTCGHSNKQPLCDGRHKGTSFSPMLFTSNITNNEALCLCKQSRLMPYCDGAHAKL